jgi:hypothetical protein
MEYGRQQLLSKDADYTTTKGLAEYLLGRLNELVPHYNLLDMNHESKDYFNGLINAYENVLMAIGYPYDQLPKYEDN